jgi:kynurenine formamidase
VRFTAALLLALGSMLPFTVTAGEVGASPWGPDDEIGRLNLMTDESRADVLRRVRGGKIYDLAVEYRVGMPSWFALGDPRYQFWLTHTPRGTAVDDPLSVGDAMNAHVSYTGDAVSMYTHMGTHVDALNHFGLDGRIWNGFSADEHLGDRGWTRAGAEKIPPIVARGVLIDLPAALGVEELAPGYRVAPADLERALKRQKVALREGDVVLVRTGRMRHVGDASAYMTEAPGLTLDAARWLVEEHGAMALGADNLSFEVFPGNSDESWVPVHTYLLAEQGVTILEVVDLEGLATDGVYEFAFVGASLKLAGASGAPMRPIAMPIR